MRILALTSLLLVSIACHAQIGAKAKQSSQLTGIWQNSQFGYQMTLMLNADGTGEFDGEQVKYTAKGGVLSLTITSQQETNNYSYALNGNSLTVSGGDLDQPVTFTRSGSGANASPTENPPATAQANSGNNLANNNLLGVWSGNGETIEFKDNGQCVYLGNTYTYTASQGVISLSTVQGAVSFNYTINNNQLTLAANGNQVVYQRGTAGAQKSNPGNTGGEGAKNVPPELVGKWCWVNVTTTNSGGSSSDTCITLNGDGSYQYYSERSMSVNDPSFAGGTNSQNSDRGTWWVQGDRIFYNSQSQGQGSYRLEKRNHPKNVNDPMIVLDGQPFVTQFQKAPWR